MAKHDGSTNTEAFTSPEHAMLCGGISMVLHLNFPEYQVDAVVNDNDDYLPAIDMVMKTVAGRRFRVIVAEVVE